MVIALFLFTFQILKLSVLIHYYKVVIIILYTPPPPILRFFPPGHYKTVDSVSHHGFNTLHVILDLKLKYLPLLLLSYSPGVAVSIDEAMIAFRGRLHFKQYVKNKPTPWGVKVWCSCDPSNGYLLDFRFYTGKSDNPMPNGLGHHVVMDVGSRFLDKYHHFYFDNYFSSVQLAKDLLDRSTYSCATTRQNRKHWPRDLKSKLNKGECRMRQFGNIVCTYWSDKRQISLISTNASPEMGTATRRTKEGPLEKQVPMPVLYYNSNMGGVDLNDQLRTYYPVGRKSMKWWRCCFWYLFEVALLNAYLLYKSMPRPQGSPKPLDHFTFHLSIARALCQGGTATRQAPEGGPAAAGLAVRNQEKHRRVRLPGRKKQCYQCRQKDVKTDSGRRPETVFGCPLCNTHLCDELCFAEFHSNFLD